MMRGNVISHNGRLALECNLGPARDRPVLQKRVWVFTEHPADGAEEAGLIGREAKYSGVGERWNVYLGNGTWRTLDVTGCVSEVIDEPVPRPRDGKTYTWRWSSWSSSPVYTPCWVRERFPICPECQMLHAPHISPCPICGDCHRGKCRPVECYGCGEKFRPDATSAAWCPRCR